jgi:hypothetical protein
MVAPRPTCDQALICPGGAGARVALTIPVGDEEIDKDLKGDEPIAAKFGR